MKLYAILNDWLFLAMCLDLFPKPKVTYYA